MKRKGNLSEELYNMRKLMNFNSEKFRSETTSLDRLVEEKMMEKYLLSEQEVNGDPEVRQTDEKKTEELLPSDIEIDRYGQAIESYVESLKRKIKERDGFELHDGGNPTIELQRKKELDEYPDDIYEKFLIALNNGRNNTNWKFWYQDLTQDTRKVFLKQFQDWVSSGDKQLKKLIGEEGLKNKNWKIKADISKGKKGDVTTKGEVPAAPAEPLDFDLVGKNTFIDNVSDISPDMQTKIDEFIKDITPQIKELQSEKVKVNCDKLDVAASSSRVRNTEGAKDLTWSQLSEQRANKVYEEIYRRLEELGVTLTNVNKVLRGGTNDDGTSGPDPSNNYKFDSGKSTTNMQYSDDGITPLSGVDSKRQLNGYPNLLSSQAESHQYKFCIVEVVLSSLREDDPEPFTETIVDRGWSIVFSVGYIIGQPRRLGDFPKLEFKRKKGKSTPNITKCVPFSGGVRGGS